MERLGYDSVVTAALSFTLRKPLVRSGMAGAVSRNRYLGPVQPGRVRQIEAVSYTPTLNHSCLSRH
jgi:hypothetical protein